MVRKDVETNNVTPEQLTDYLRSIGYTPTFEKAISAFQHNRMLGNNLCKLREEVDKLIKEDALKL